ncbi:hypothetical protein [Serpentinicella alkaliphila]|uniref:Uncharacterized protein n=1 Tax=Serpentinicella alkaliphila TaxID=1734049 RepID=A0A4R2TV24_9FIRM|nr:hypothetical protein [Serpentinicella alkaliphila]QUH25747.1 hypothetical protein HZR23_08360 [Serpentinicella alkaliphila]TCP99002.1 hypothetical protein EDD79_10384 [Serpentinicella alkaliphila]
MKNTVAKTLIITLTLLLIIPSTVFANNGRGNGANKKGYPPGSQGQRKSNIVRQEQSTEEVIVLTPLNNSLIEITLESSLIQDGNQEKSSDLHKKEEIKDKTNKIIKAKLKNKEKQQIKKETKIKHNNGLNGLLNALENARNTPAFSVISHLIELRGGMVEDIVDSKDEVLLNEDEKTENVVDKDKEIKVENTNILEDEEVNFRAAVLEALELSEELDKDLVLTFENYVVLLRTLLQI